MSTDVIILGLVQGFTEFLPVSSSGHLALAQIFLGTNMPPLSYDLVLHMATALATIIFFFADIFALFVQWLSGFRSKDARKSSGWSTGWAVVSGTVITAVIGLTLKDFAEVAMMNSLMVGCGLTFTGFLLLFSSFVKTGLGRVRLTDGVIVGIAQGIAVMVRNDYRCRAYVWIKQRRGFSFLIFAFDTCYFGCNFDSGNGAWRVEDVCCRSASLLVCRCLCCVC